MLKKILAQALLLVLCLSSAGIEPVYSAEETPTEIPIDLDSAASTDTISMSFDGALLKDVLLLFSQQSGLNFIASQEVESKKVTVYFENVTPKDALDAIVTANGLAYSKKTGSDIFIVYPSTKVQASELVTRVIRLKYMRLSNSPLDVGGRVTISDLEKSSADSSGGGGESGGDSGSSGGGGGGGSSSGGSATSSGGGGSGDKGADKMLQKLLSPQGKLTSDLSTNSVIITDTKESIAAIEKILEQVDVPPSQVILEVHIMEVSKTLLNNVGIEWGGTNGAMLSLNGGAQTTTFPFQEKVIKKIFESDEVTGVASSPAALTTAVGDALGPQMSFGTIDATNLAATLHFIQNDNRTKILARPRVLTQNNEAASIKLVTNALIGEDTNTNTQNNTETTTAERSDIGVTMRMTPQINADDTVSLFLEPAVATVAPSSLVSTRSDPTTRMVRTMARVKNDSTLVIGGLIDGQNNTRRQKVPFLGDLPVIGKAFYYDADTDFDRELLVFVTPHIVRGPTSLGTPSATARGEDVAVRRMLDQFMDREMDSMTAPFQSFEKTKQNFFTREEELIRDAEQRYSNPVVETQMTQALDALSPQMVDQQISQTMDTMGSAKAG